MPVMRAFWFELLRSLDFKGRTPRARYFGFLFVATSLLAGAIWLAVAILPHGRDWIGVCILIALFYIPVTSAGVRRLHDTGQSGVLMLDPLKPMAAFGLCLLIIGAATFSNTVGFVAFYTSVFLLGKFMVAVMSILALLMLGLTMMFFSNTMGQLMLPSQPSSNKYCLNQNEVAT
ncbi:DUF805 domain-containing protein [Microbulbifer sp. S227A]|uniref:DUF805 domain-containing protein n=1 Tax=Microbulbifer sp. S227A TaxID=3415131 RepID=UPI003C7E2654